MRLMAQPSFKRAAMGMVVKEGGWQVKRDGGKRASHVAGTKAEAENNAVT